MKILGLYHAHDACAALYDDYQLLAAVALERPTRIKGDGRRHPSEAIDECVIQAGITTKDIDVVLLPRTDYPVTYYKPRAFVPFGSGGKGNNRELMRILARQKMSDPHQALRAGDYLHDNGLQPGKIAFYNHHLSHALATLFHTDWEDALLYTSDGGGDRTFYSARQLKDGRLAEIFGGESASRALLSPQRKQDSLGLLYYYVTEALGFTPLRHEGKVLGLAAFGKPKFAEDLMDFYTVHDDGQIRGRTTIKKIANHVHQLATTAAREDVAASVQDTLEKLTIQALEKIVNRHPAKNLGVSGGVFANVKLTQRIDEYFNFDEIFVYPAMSDQGEAAGGVLQYLLERDGLSNWLKHRQRFGNLYFGCDYMSSADATFERSGAKKVAATNIAATAAKLIDDGKVVGTYLGRCEYGPRALGARSIMAAPTDRAINDWLNQRLDRTEFMPFAPVVREERCADVFELPQSLYYTARYMTVTCDVKPEWRDKIPAVVHVDGTARPQLIRRQDNNVYYDILKAYEERTQIPVAINTSFNVHEQPIINRPEEALKALQQERVDVVVTETSIWSL